MKDQALSATVRAITPDDTSPAILAALARSRTSWPALQLDEPGFTAHVRAVAAEPEGLALHGDDLALAYACSRGQAYAFERLEQVLVQEVTAAGRRLRLEPAAVDELHQEVRLKLLLGAQPRISRYSARGPLRSWLRTFSLRLALDSAERSGRDLPAERDALLTTALWAGLDPEAATSKGDLTDRLQAALEKCLDELDVRDRTLLKLHFVEGATLNALAAIYRVHRATIARWLLSARACMVSGLQQRLGGELPLDSAELRSIVRLCRSQLELSLSRRVLPARG